MENITPKAVIGTNSWGGKLYETILRGNSVSDETLIESMGAAKKKGLLVFDLAQDYGLGKAQKMIGKFGTQDIILSSKFTPMKKYRQGQVRKSLERDLKEFKRDFVDIYWLHLPSDIEENIREMIALYHEGKIHHIGVSNFSLEECRLAKNLLEEANIPLYGVQNHYSLLTRVWEEKGLLNWCRENHIQFWAWAVLEEGILAKPKSKSAMSLTFGGKIKKLKPLYEQMASVGERYHMTIAQVAISYCASKGIVPICGCRKPYQVEALAEAANTQLSDEDLLLLEEKADKLKVQILGADMFRFMVRKKK